MDSFYMGIFNALGKRYEMQVYERSRRMSVAAQRSALRLDIVSDEATDERLARQIKLTERLMALLAEEKSK